MRKIGVVHAILVTLIVAACLTGCTSVSVPDVVGMTQSQAQTSLQLVGLTVGTVTHQTSTTVPDGTVISQNPAAGASVSSGTAVALIVSSGPAGEGEGEGEGQGQSPTVTITSTAPDPTRTSPIPVNVTFSEPVTGFTAGDITPANATLNNFQTVDASHYTFNLVPAGQGAATASIAAAVAADLAGNANTAATPLSRTYDTVGPAVSMASTAPDPTNTSPIPVSVTFSEAVTGFSSGDITPTNATIGNFQTADTSHYSFDLTPTGQGTVTAAIARAVATDLAGNANAAATPFSRAYGSAAPTVSLASTAPDPTDISPIPVTATFSEPVTGFDATDVTVSNGTLGQFQTIDASHYSFNLTPAGQGAVTAAVAAGAAQDAAGNGNTAAPQFSRTYDSVAPTVTLASSSPDPTNIWPIPVTVTFSEAVTGFASGDITATNATIGNFQTTDASHYRFDLAPADQGTVSVALAAGIAQDAAGNPNTASPPLTRTYVAAEGEGEGEGEMPAGTVRTFAGIDFVWCPPGTLMMGATANEQHSNDWEKPQHQVTLTDGFWLSKYLVTQAQWVSVMGSNPSHFTEDASRPVEQVSWNDVTQTNGFLDKLNTANPGNMYRLPTEAEWEYACRAGTTTRFYWGDDPNYTQITDYAWYDSNSGNTTHPVGQKTPNSWGLYDMSGNVFEWCQDWYGSYAAGAQTDPTGPSTGLYRTIRGGNWTNNAADCRAASRSYAHDYAPDYRCSNLGFRLALSGGAEGERGGEGE